MFQKIQRQLVVEVEVPINREVIMFSLVDEFVKSDSCKLPQLTFILSAGLK